MVRRNIIYGPEAFKILARGSRDVFAAGREHQPLVMW